MYFVKIVFSMKEPVKKQNQASYNLGKVFAKPTSDKGFLSRRWEECLKLCSGK